MSTGIEWTDETWNVVTGCDRTSPGCDNCYALTMAGRLKAMGQAKYQNDGDPRTSGPGFAVTCHPDELTRPLRWKRPRMVFTPSMGDLFHPEVIRTDRDGVLHDEEPFSPFLWDVFRTMKLCPEHTFQVLTKRPQAMAAWFQRLACPFQDSCPLPNVWLGTSIESDRYCFRADHLRETPAAVRFLSLEPLLGPLPSLNLDGIDWVIVGGESGQHARPMHPAWVRDIRDRCVAAGVPFFFKQYGSWTWQYERPGAPPPDLYIHADGRTATEDEALADGGSWQGVWRLGKKRAGRRLDGETWSQMPSRGTDQPRRCSTTDTARADGEARARSLHPAGRNLEADR